MDDVTNFNMNNLYNCMWNVIITLSSVGYGEMYAVTNFGRIIGMIICFWGLFVVSSLVDVVTGQLEFARMEEKAYSLLVRLLLKKQINKEAVDVL